jgi:hypothetical protein
MSARRRACESARMKIRKPPPLARDEEPQIETPVIDMQDLEHQPGIDTRVSNAGVEVLPQIDLSQDDEKARKAIEELEMRVGLTPGL